MRLLRTVLFAVMTIVSGCSYYANLNGTVVDGATGQPLEGALVVAQWTKPRGIPGLQHHELHKITETQTDKEGKFSISGTSGFWLDPPEMIIYKAGYVPWRNDMIFPGGTDSLAKDHEWKHNATYKLDVYVDKYPVGRLHDFLVYGIMGSYRAEVPRFSDILRKIPRE